jgi:hypothetical protein
MISSLLALAACSSPAPAVETAAPVDMSSATGQAPAASSTEMVTTPAALPGTGDNDLSALPEIAIEAVDFSFKMPETLQAGWTRVKLTNSGAEPHHVQFLLLNTGVTMEQFQEALKQGEGPALALVQAEGGVGSVAPGGSAEVALNLPAGEYVVICLVPSPSDNLPHFAKGMIHHITVGPAAGSAGAEPKAALDITLRDFGFDMPDSLPTGMQVVKVTNQGPEWHELNILRLAEGKTLADVQAFFKGEGPAGPPPFTPAGGINGLGVGGSGYMLLNLEPGNYVAICNIPSAANQGAPHFMLGMIKEFSIGK